MTALNLEELVRRAQKGDAQALGELVRETQSRAYRFCLMMCRDSALAQDLLQDTYVRALGEVRKLKEPGRFMPWLHRIAKNLYLDYLKSPKNAETDSLDEAKGPASTLMSKDDIEFSVHLKETLAQLEPEERILLLLVDLEEYSYREAAGILGISESNVRFKLHHVRKKFINKFDE